MKQKVIVLGGGESGFGAAILAQTKGYDTFVSDSGLISATYKARLEEYKIPYEEGGHSNDIILAADLIIKSPGIPEKATIIKSLRKKGIPIISEIEFAGRFTKGKTICVTGSNGKTTTTTLIHKILSEAGYNVGIAGNIGESFAYMVATADKEWYVLEISSFQLDDCLDFKANIGVLMNITPDHLDRYNYNFQNYVDSKMKIINNQTSEDVFIYCGDDKTIVSEVDKIELKAITLPFGKENICDNVFTVNISKRELTANVNRLEIKGLHNTYNAMAASLVALTAGVNKKQIIKSIYSFAGVEHRLERVVEINGVEYINDSKATNVDATWYALESMTRPTIWIAGGVDKGNDYDTLKELAVQKVKALICLGVNNEKLISNFRELSSVYSTSSLDEAMKICKQLAQSGDSVLLSPACASFDLFEDYVERGNMFKNKVMEIKNG